MSFLMTGKTVRKKCTLKTSYRIDEKTIILEMIDLRYQDIRETNRFKRINKHKRENAKDACH